MGSRRWKIGNAQEENVEAERRKERG